MKQAVALGTLSWLLCPLAFAIAPVTLSEPSPAISSVYNANTSTLVTYTIKNNVPKSLPLSVSGIFNGIQRATVSGDCGNALPAGPSTCHFGILISPSAGQVGSSINQTLRIDYQGRTPLTSPISFSISSQTFAYVTPALNATAIDQFLLSNDGLLTSYTTAHAASSSETFGQMTFATVNGIQHPYILDPNGAVYWCNINTNGSFSNCLPTASLPPVGSWQARGIAFATFNTQYAYIVDPGNNLVFQCAVNSTGDFSNCQQSPLSTLAPFGIAFVTNVNGDQHAYIADAGSGSGFGDVLLCSMQNDGSFNTCTQTPLSGAPNWIPFAVAFTTVNGTQYAYVADNGTGTPGHVYRCTLNNDGSFANSSCIQTPANDSSLSNWYPYYIAFQTVNGTKYAYVVNSSGSSIGNIYRCLVDNNGLLMNCALTPDTPLSSWQPSGIAFR